MVSQLAPRVTTERENERERDSVSLSVCACVCVHVRVCTVGACAPCSTLSLQLNCSTRRDGRVTGKLSFLERKFEGDDEKTVKHRACTHMTKLKVLHIQYGFTVFEKHLFLF